MPATMLCERCHEMVSQRGAEITNDVNGCNLFGDLKQLDALIGHLELKRANVKRKINYHYSPIIQQLPHDVLSVIFNFCLPDYITFHASLSEINLSAPLILGAVCKDWRETAWSSPRLWSAMAINISSSETIFESQTSIAREWLARSGRLPLSIRIVSKMDLEHFNFRLALELMTVINGHMSRWHTFHLSVRSDDYNLFNLCKPDGFTAPMLESLHIHFDEPQPFIRGLPKFHLFHCPRLQEIRITNVSVRWIKVPKDSVTRIYVNNLSLQDCAKILRKTPFLVHCFMDVKSESYLPRPLSTNVKHLTLRLGKAGESDVDDFIDDITAPCLESLRVESSQPDGSSYIAIAGIQINCLCSFLSRSACSLHTFSLVDAMIQRDITIGLLREMPALKHLTVSVPPLRSAVTTEIMLEVIAMVIASQGKPTRQGFLANLETLTYTGNSRVRPSRVPYIIPVGPWNYFPQRPLSSVTLKLRPVKPLPKEIIPFLRTLKEYGVTLTVCATNLPLEDLLQSTIDFYESSSLREVDQTNDLSLSLEEARVNFYKHGSMVT